MHKRNGSCASCLKTSRLLWFRSPPLLNFKKRRPTSSPAREGVKTTRPPSPSGTSSCLDVGLKVCDRESLSALLFGSSSAARTKGAARLDRKGEAMQAGVLPLQLLAAAVEFRTAQPDCFAGTVFEVSPSTFCASAADAAQAVFLGLKHEDLVVVSLKVRALQQPLGSSRADLQRGHERVSGGQDAPCRLCSSRIRRMGTASPRVWRRWLRKARPSTADSLPSFRLAKRKSGSFLRAAQARLPRPRALAAARSRRSGKTFPRRHRRLRTLAVSLLITRFSLRRRSSSSPARRRACRRRVRRRRPFSLEAVSATRLSSTKSTGLQTQRPSCVAWRRVRVLQSA